MIPQKPHTFLVYNDERADPINKGEDELSSWKMDLTKMGEELSERERKRETAYRISKHIQSALSKVRNSMEYSGNDSSILKHEKELDSIVMEHMTEPESETNILLNANSSESNTNAGKDDGMALKDKDENILLDSNNAPRISNLGYTMEDFVRFKAFRYFLSTGRLVPFSKVTESMTSTTSPNIRIRDDEYLGGACILLSHDLSRYAVGRAIVRDVQSVQMARDLVEQLNMQLLQFDFRNGPLRRKYDSVKYALKKIETILYELSVTDNKAEKEETMVESPTRKRMKLTDDNQDNEKNNCLDEVELHQIRSRMEKRDEIREQVIKRCRDGQKAAKQAIFALHRKDIAKSKSLIAKCEAIIHELLPLIKQDPCLRNNSSSFCAVLEEYAEAKLFYEWLKSDGKYVLPWTAMPISLTPEEYLGGLCDLTGEIGRYAVKMGTSRDSNAVQQCLATNMSILYALQSIPLPGDINKKLGALRMSVEKLEHIMYELCLIKAGRSAPADSVNDYVKDSTDK